MASNAAVFSARLVVASLSSAVSTSLPAASFAPHPRPQPPSRPRFRALKVESRDSDWLRKPTVSPPSKDSAVALDGDNGDSERQGGENESIDWEDRMLEDTVPLVAFVRMILHSGKYESGDRLIPQHEKTIREGLLHHHPESEKKIGCGIDYITIGYHPDFEVSKCLFIVRKNGDLVDFSYWKCIKGLIRTKYPLYADSFILKHFGQRKHSNRR